MSKTLRRIFSGLGANVFAQAVTVATQLLSLPIFLHFWNSTQYGEWLLLAAIPAYLSMADIGLVAVGKNKMTMLTTEKSYEKAAVVFQSVLFLIILAIVVVGGVAISAIWVWGFGHITAHLEQRVTLSLLVLTSLANIYVGLFDAVFRSTGYYADGVYALSLARVAEWGGSLIGLILGGSLVTVSFGLFCGRITANLMIWAYLAKRFRQYQWGVRKASKNELVSMLVPAISFMALPIGNALSIQGMTILVGNLFGPAALAVFSTYRTLSRTTVQLIDMLSRVLSPEFSSHYGRGAIQNIRAMYRLGTMATVITSLAGATTLHFVGADILGWWTRGKIAYIPELFNLFLLLTLFTGFWQVGLSVLSAVNRLQSLSAIYMVASVVSLVLAMIAGRMFGINGAVSSLVVIELVMLGASYLSVRSFLQEPCAIR